jgi:hypothetical protein
MVGRVARNYDLMGWARLKHSLQLLVGEANIQLGELPDFCLRSDELFLSFNKWRMALVGNFQSEISLTNHLASTRSNGIRTYGP